MAQPERQPGSKFRSGQTEVDGLPIRYLDAGQGNPVIILDGFALGLSTLCDALAEQNQVFAIEVSGLDNSPADAKFQSAKDLANIAAHAAAKLIPDKFTLIGISFGADVALWQALQAPDRVEALVLISPTLILPEKRPATESLEEAAAFLFAHPDNSEKGPSADPTVSAKTLELVERLRRSGHDAAVESRLSEIQCPTLVVFGASDKLVKSGAARIYGERIPNGHVSFVYDAGHLIEADRPQPLVNVVSDFVERRETFVVARQSDVINP